jgi:glucose/mannose-6-phosphate isomerase
MTLIKNNFDPMIEMEQLISDFPNQLKESIGIARAQKIEQFENIANVVICGLGGSGIGGEIIRQWLLNSSKIPITVSHRYDLPRFVNSETLVIACSYSGNTEETLTALAQAIDYKAKIIVITSGGKISEIAQTNNFPAIIIPGGLPPRSALAYPLVQLAGIFDRLKLATFDLIPSIEEAVIQLNQSKQTIVAAAREILALREDRQFLFYAEDQFAPTLLRACQQINENGKELAFYNIIPEMNHNEIVGWAKEPKFQFVVIFRSNLEHARNSARLEFIENYIRSKTNALITLQLKGTNLIEQTLFGIQLVDWLSFFTAQKKDIDVVEVDVIDQLKEVLGKLP